MSNNRRNYIIIDNITSNDIRAKQLRILKANKFLFPKEERGVPETYLLDIEVKDVVYEVPYRIGSKDERSRSGILRLGKLLFDEVLKINSSTVLKLSLIGENKFRLETTGSINPNKANVKSRKKYRKDIRNALEKLYYKNGNVIITENAFSIKISKEESNNSLYVETISKDFIDTIKHAEMENISYWLNAEGKFYTHVILEKDSIQNTLTELAEEIEFIFKTIYDHELTDYKIEFQVENLVHEVQEQKKKVPLYPFFAVFLLILAVFVFDTPNDTSNTNSSTNDFIKYKNIFSQIERYENSANSIIRAMENYPSTGNIFELHDIVVRAKRECQNAHINIGMLKANQIKNSDAKKLINQAIEEFSAAYHLKAKAMDNFIKYLETEQKVYMFEYKEKIEDANAFLTLGAAKLHEAERIIK